MDNKIIKELNEMKYLFGYERGRVISEQNIPIDELDMEVHSDEVPSFDLEGMFKGMSKPNGDMEIEEDMDIPVMSPGTKEKERTITTPGIKPGTKPGTPYRPKPGPKKNPKADMDDVDMPEWLSFDELGLNFED